MLEELEKLQEKRVKKFFLEGIMNFCTKFHCNSSHSSENILFKTKNANFMVAQKKTEDHCREHKMEK